MEYATINSETLELIKRSEKEIEAKSSVEVVRLSEKPASQKTDL